MSPPPRPLRHQLWPDGGLPTLHASLPHTPLPTLLSFPVRRLTSCTTPPSSPLPLPVSEVGVPEVVVYNAARINYGMFGQYATEDIITDFKIPNLGPYTTAGVLLPHLRALAESEASMKPSLFAAQASLVKLLADGNKDIVHVVLLTVGGQVSFDEEVNNPQNIATKFWELYEQKKGNWSSRRNADGDMRMLVEKMDLKAILIGFYEPGIN
ncbi:hypothetical protein EPUS_06576 [Endocarpon pusillum Z07020]|uniref:Uncharacterized protein n=1 Tax=Endocarpon pusillum (strain Z07020 / HMAS-L-300199) TaxID=1263415 RepID=U1GPY8_ENDPU|nr:uncharacterized protein EPUS_06576 [Endocarpon pusillum Z07020]ERF74398.1 hypothetical protein EPUS_06576 [Endocarpon pusillum Z07020]